MTSWMGVVAYISHARGGQVLPANLQQLFLDRIRHPGIDAMAQDVIECAEVGGDIHDVKRMELNILQAENICACASHSDGSCRQVEAHEAAVRKCESHRDEVPPVTAGDFEHPATVHWRGRHAEQSGQSG